VRPREAIFPLFFYFIPRVTKNRELVSRPLTSHRKGDPPEDPNPPESTPKQEPPPADTFEDPVDTFEADEPPEAKP
jgi:hypothetical protein